MPEIEEEKKTLQPKKARQNQSKFYEEFEPIDVRPEEIAAAILQQAIN